LKTDRSTLIVMTNKREGHGFHPCRIQSLEIAALAAEGYPIPREKSRFLDSADHSQANDPAPLGMTNRNDKIET